MTSRFFKYLLCVQSLALTSPVFSNGVSDLRQQELLYLVQHDCGSCHGMTLKGGLGAPLTSDRLRNKPDELLSNIILNGLSGTAMPPWRGILNETEANWIVTRLKSGEIKNN